MDNVYFTTEGSGTKTLDLEVMKLTDEVGTDIVENPTGHSGEVNTSDETVSSLSSTSTGDVWFTNYSSTSSGFSVEIHANSGSSKLGAYKFLITW